MPNPAEAARSPRRNSPPCRSTICAATLDRSFADELWSRDGIDQPRRPGRPRSAVVRGTGILKTDIKYDEIIDMSFVENG